jgi:tetratricopeptide (TPR) repeat protein
MITRKRSAITIGVTAFVAALLFTTAPRAQDARGEPPRFDNLVRSDFFAGFSGDATRLAQGMKLCEEALAADPDRADALVWHGAGLMFMAGEAQARQDLETARERSRRGAEELERAHQLAPDSLSVILVRAVVLNASAPRVTDRARAQVMQRAAVDGFERALAMQTPYLDSLSEHSRGELLGGLAEGWSRLGEQEKARGYVERMAKELPDTRYQARARAWLEDGPKSGSLTCLSCHRP